MPTIRNRFLALAAIAGLAILALVWEALNHTRIFGRMYVGPVEFSEPEKPAYLRVNVSDKNAVFVEFEGSVVRVATTAKGLETAMPIRVGAGIMPHSNQVNISIPANQLPAGVSSVNAFFTIYGMRPLDRAKPETVVDAKFEIVRMDDQKGVWQYSLGTRSTVGSSASKAPTILLPSLEKLPLSVAGVPLNGSLGLSADIWTGGMELYDLHKDGKPVEVQVKVLDASGKEVASKKGPLADLRVFDRFHPNAVIVTKGDYTCLATLDAGPCGGILKAETKVTVP